jgi:hypothetical protein
VTSQPYQSQANGPSEPFGRPATDSEPDLVIVDHADDLDDDDAHEYGDDVIVAEITQVGMREPAATASQDDGDVSPNGAVPESDVLVATADTTEPEPASRGDIGEQWHDIQAMFVDDPQGSVERAAQAADAAVSALVDSLRERHAALTPPGVPGDPGDTEKLRETLRAYRIFCQQLTELDGQLPRADAMAG